MSFLKRTRRTAQMVPNPLNLPPQIYSFLMGIVEDCGVPLSADDKEEMITRIVADFNFFMAGSLLHVLPTKAFDEFTRLNASGRSPAEVHSFLIAHLPDSQRFFTECFIAFRNLYLALPSSGGS